MDYPLCALQRGWWGGSRTCFREDILTKTGTEEGDRELAAAFSLSRFASLLFWFYFIIIFFTIIIIFFITSPPPSACVRDREMFAELLCGAVALVLYVNTLGADFCYDDRYLLVLNEWRPAPRVTNTAVPTVCLCIGSDTPQHGITDLLSFIHSFIVIT